MVAMATYNALLTTLIYINDMQLYQFGGVAMTTPTIEKVESYVV